MNLAETETAQKDEPEDYTMLTFTLPDDNYTTLTATVSDDEKALICTSDFRSEAYAASSPESSSIVALVVIFLQIGQNS